MSRLPVVSSDGNAWGTILNDFLSVSHNADGTLKGPMFLVDDFGADPTGVADSTTAFVNATAAAVATLSGSQPGAYVALSAGTYNVTCGNWVMTDPRIGVVGPGSAICQINAYGAGDVLYLYSGAFSTRHAGLMLSGFSVDGTNINGASKGLHLADISRLQLNDLAIANFTYAGSYGIYWTTIVGWSEDTVWNRVDVDNCVIDVCFDGTSFDYLNMQDLRLGVNPGQVGVQVQNAAQLDQVIMNVRWNAQASGGADSTIFVIGPTGAAGETSRIKNSMINFQGEVDGSSSTVHDMTCGANCFITAMGTFISLGAISAGTVAGGSYVSGAITTPVFTQAHKQSDSGGMLTSFAAAFPTPPLSKGLTLIDPSWSSSTTRSTLYSGSGAPTLSANSGDFYFRQDTPSTANQRLYVCTGSSSWTAIL